MSACGSRTTSESDWHEDVLRTIIATSVIGETHHTAGFFGAVDVFADCSCQQSYGEGSIGSEWNRETFGIRRWIGGNPL